MTRLRLALAAIVVIAGGVGYQQVNADPTQTASSAPLDDPKPPRMWPSTTTTTAATTTTTAPPTTTAAPTTTTHAPLPRSAPSPVKPSVAATLPPTAAPTPPPPPPPPAPMPEPASVDAGAESYVLQRLKADRGGRPIELSSGARSVARSWSSYMATQARMGHNGDLKADLTRAGVTGFTVWGENVGQGPTIDKIYAGLMASSGHRARMLSGEFSQVGIGVVRQGGTLWLTMDFVGY